jgi:mutator protein MutT
MKSMIKGVDYIGVAVGAFVLNEKGELFLMKRGKKAKNEKGTWEAPGGAVEFGETLLHAIKREMKEEFGTTIEVLEQFPAVDHFIVKEKQHWVPTTFLCRFKKSSIPQILEPEKCEEIAWFSLNKLPRPLSLVTKLNIKYYKNHINKALL